ncbi:reverse transcriptase domain-containing protein [Tanacetum coccineum]
MTPIYKYLTEETLPVEKEKARAVRRKSRRYVVISEILYKKSYLGSWILLANNACGCKKNDSGMLRLPGSPHRAKKPATKADSHHVPMAILQMRNQHSQTFLGRSWHGQIPNSSNRLFYKVDRSKTCRNNNGDNPFKDWCEKLCIRQRFAFVKHPQANSLVERANKSLGEGIKAWLDERSKDWIEEVPHVLWAHHTMIKSSNEDNPFSLTYETKAVILAEIGMPTLRTTKIDMVKNDEALEINLDLLEERREQVAIREARSKEKMEKYYNFKVRNTSFKPGDLLYQNNDASHARDSGKLGPKWEVPYEVTEALGKGAYKLRDRDRKLLPRTWNVHNLKKCYVHEM